MKKLLFISILAIFSLTAASETITFNVGSGDWNVAGNWTPAQVPTAGDDVIIGTGNHCTIQSGTDAFALNVVVQTTASLTVLGTLTFSAGVTTQCNSTSVYYEVTSAVTTKIWLDRNLGASQVATIVDDPLAYGDLYQWGRANEEHQCRSSATSTTLATTAVPNSDPGWDGLFIISPTEPHDWLATQDEDLWQGESGTNNPCPSGYRIPTADELLAEGTNGPYASQLKLTVGGQRADGSGDISTDGTAGYYWSSTVEGQYSKWLYFDSKTSNGVIIAGNRAKGHSVRCIKE